MEPVDHGFWATMTVNFYSNVKGKGCFFWLNIAWANASDSFEKPFSDRSIPSKIKLTSVRNSIGTDSFSLALSNLKLAFVDWHFKRIPCLTGPAMFTSDSKTSWAFWVLLWTAESKNTLNLLPDNPLSNPGTLASKSPANWDTWVLYTMPCLSRISPYIASSSPTIKTMPELANSVSLMYRMILFKTSSLIQVWFVESMLFVVKKLHIC